MSSGVVVMGMMRSGTSATAQVTSVLLGAQPPKTELPASPHNARGYWESEPVNHMNDRILRTCGATWSAPPPHAVGPDELALSWANKEAALLFSEEYPFEPWVCKDPRFCFTLPFWEAVIGKKPVVFVWREPGAVIDSLTRMANVPPALAEALWLRYNSVGVGNLADHDVCVAEFPLMLREPEMNVGRLATFLETTLGIHIPEERCERAVLMLDAGLVNSNETSRNLTPAYPEQSEQLKGILMSLETGNLGREEIPLDVLLEIARAGENVVAANRFSSLVAWDRGESLSEPRVAALRASQLGEAGVIAAVRIGRLLARLRLRGVLARVLGRLLR